MNLLKPISAVFLALLLLLGGVLPAFSQQNPIAFVTQVPKPDDFANIVSTFANHQGSVRAAPRGGDLWIRYPDGSLRNLTREAGYGENGLQGDNAIAVRDPVVHWSGDKILFSMVVGAPGQYEYNQYRFQLYEVNGLRKNNTAVIRKVSRQPRQYNNVMGVYAPDDSIIFASDRPRGGEAHLYPQLDEYESTPTNTGLWKLNPGTGELTLLDHSPSGDFHPLVDSFGRVLFTRWDHLQQDQQAENGAFGAFNYANERANSRKLSNRKEYFPEPRSEARREKQNVALHTFNRFMPWMMNPDGTKLETLNHIGRHELDDYFQQTFLNDSSLDEFIDSRDRISRNSVELDNFFTMKESPTQPGLFWGTNGSEFYTHGAGQIVTLNGAPDVNAMDMRVREITHPATASPANGSPSSGHSGLYRNPLPLSDGGAVVVHTPETRIDLNIGSRENPRSRYDFRIKRLVKPGTFWRAGAPITSGISKTVSYYDPDVLVQYSGELWELQPVEVKPQPRPSESRLGGVPSIERSVFQSEQVSLNEFQDYLARYELALVVTRDVRSRDEAERQQPFLLSIDGNSRGAVSGLQFIQGDQVRAYESFIQGRRVLPRILNSVLIPPQLRESRSQGSYEVYQDGSVAAIVPAKRALSWQLVNGSGEPIVRERYWTTFQAGEVRVCTSCHGLNKRDHSGRRHPQNEPRALRELLRWWKSAPDKDIRNPDGQLDPPSAGEGGILRLKISRRQGGRIRLRLRGVSDTSGMILQVSLPNGRVLSTRSWGERKRVSLRLPARVSKKALIFSLTENGSLVTQKRLKRSRR